MRRMFLVCIAACAAPLVAAIGGEEYATTTSRSELIDFLNAEAKVYLDRRSEVVAAITTRKQADARQADVRAKLRSLIGEPVHGYPLASKKTGMIEGEGFRIENVLYDAQPGRHVTANLYLPTGNDGPWPAVLLSPGHSPEGKLSIYSFAANLARNGIVALAYDIVGQGERLEYFDPATGMSRAERPTGDHSVAAFPAILAGGHLARYFIEDAMQGIDYLVSRPDVDADRIGAFGCSGGGTVTTYLAALDERVKAAATACYVTDFENLLATAGPQEAEQSIPGFIAAGLDITDWLELAAPKPYAVVSTTEDMFPFSGATVSVAEARAFWTAYGAAEKLEWITGPGGHGAITPFGDEIVDFFRRSLDASAPTVAFSSLRPDDPEKLLVTPTGQLTTSIGTVTLADLERERIASIPPRSYASPEALSAVIAELANVQTVPGGIADVRSVSEKTECGLTFAKFQLASRMGPLDMRMIHAGGSKEMPVLLVLDPDPMEVLARADGPLANLAREGWHIIALQVRGADGEGEAKSDFVGNQNLLALRAMLAGYTLPGLRIDDVIAAMDWIESNAEGQPVTILGVGTMGPVALQAAVIDSRIAAVHIDRSVVSLRSSASVPIARNLPANTIPGMLAHYDLPDVIAALAPRPVTVAAPVDPLGIALDEADFQALLPPRPNLTYTKKSLLMSPATNGVVNQ